MNPLRLASLDASPFCFAKRGGAGDFSVGYVPLCPPYRSTGQAPDIYPGERGNRWLLLERKFRWPRVT